MSRLGVGFDLDMTLVDSAPGITHTFVEAVERASGGRMTVTPEQVWPFIGLPLELTAEALAGAADPAAITDAYRELYLEIGVPRTTVMPGAREALAAVRAAGGSIIVVSAKRRIAVDAVLRAVGLDHGELAPDLVEGNRFGAAKGEALRAAGAQIYVGDHPGDIEAARAGSCTSVAVATGPTQAQDLAAADVVLDDLFAFGPWLRQWLSDRSTGPAAGTPDQ